MIWTIDHGSATSLREQIVTCTRRAVSNGELQVGVQLPPAAELADAIDVDRNTVLAAYRDLRDDGVLEFRRGRGARVAKSIRPEPAVLKAARNYLDVGASNGLATDDLIRLIKELA